MLRAFITAGAMTDAGAEALFLETVGPSFARYVRQCLPRISHCTHARDADIIRGLTRSYADYYRLMAMALTMPDLGRLPGWDECIDVLKPLRAASRGAVLISFQIGAPLLLPHLVRDGCARETAVYMHSHNSLAINFMSSAAPPIAVLDVERTTPFEAIRRLRQGEYVMANVDTAYPGFRSRSLPLLDGQLEIPAGLIGLIPNRADVPVFAIALIRTAEGFSLALDRLDCAGPASRAPALESIAAFFEPLIRQVPFQWMGWASLQDRHG